MFTAISKADRGLIFSAGPPRAAGLVPWIRLYVVWAAFFYLPFAHADTIPRVEITMPDGQHVSFPGPAPSKAAAFFENTAPEKRQAFLIKRDKYLRMGAAMLWHWYSNLRKIEWLTTMLHTACGITPPPPMTKEIRDILVVAQLIEFDEAMFEDVDRVLEATNAGAGAAVVGYASVGVQKHTLGFGQGFFVSGDFNPWSRDWRLRVGHEQERLRYVEPFLAGVGIGVRFFLYLTVPEHSKERGTYFSPMVGPSFMKTNKTVAVSKWFGGGLSTPFALVVQTDILRQHRDLSPYIKRAISFGKTCAGRMLSFAGIRPHLEEPTDGGGEPEIAVDYPEPEIGEQLPSLAEAAAHVK